MAHNGSPAAFSQPLQQCPLTCAAGDSARPSTLQRSSSRRNGRRAVRGAKRRPPRTSAVAKETSAENGNGRNRMQDRVSRAVPSGASALLCADLRAANPTPRYTVRRKASRGEAPQYWRAYVFKRSHPTTSSRRPVGVLMRPPHLCHPRARPEDPRFRKLRRRRKARRDERPRPALSPALLIEHRFASGGTR